MGSKIYNKEYNKHYSMILESYSIKQLLEYNVKPDKKFDLFDYPKIVRIYLLNSLDYIDDIEKFYNDMNVLTGNDYSTLELEKDILLNIMNRHVVSIISEY